MNREIKFRYYCSVDKCDVSFTLEEVMSTHFDWRVEYRGQYTGINDKNGKKIYEGDIVECNSNLLAGCRFISKVSFDQGMFGVAWPVIAPSTPLFKLTAFDIEVIGNIYENKELIDASN